MNVFTKQYVLDESLFLFILKSKICGKESCLLTKKKKFYRKFSVLSKRLGCWDWEQYGNIIFSCMYKNGTDGFK